MKNICTYIICLVISLPFQNAVYAQNGDNIVVPCAVPFYRELDFIVGDWQVFHKNSGKLAGYDKIGRILKGCAIQQSWISLDDHFSSEYVPFRMNGRSLTAFNGTEWLQFWVDNHAGVQVLKGGPQKDKFVLMSENSVGGFEYMLSWQREDDGSLTNIHQRREVSSAAKGEWETLYKWRYVKNLNKNIYPDDEDNQ